MSISAIGFAKRVLSRLSQKSTVAPRPANRYRPLLEQFEAREVPATLIWTGDVDTDATNPLNWTDYNNFGTPVLPAPGDDLFFTEIEPSPNSAFQDCVGLSSPNGSFAGIHMFRDRGTVTLGAALTVGTFEMYAGAISQPTSGTDLTVTGAFTWTGGTLNSASTESTVYLNGAVGTISSAGTLTLGSALVVKNGATLASDASINFSNGSPVTVDNATMTVSAVPMGGVVWSGPPGSYDDGKAKVELKTNGTLAIGTNVNFNAKNRTFLNNGGNLEISDGALATFGANVAPPLGTLKKVDIVQNSGTIKISGAGGTLKSSHGSMKMNGGTLAVNVVGDNSSEGTVDAQLTIAGGTVDILLAIGNLHVTKDLYWLGGTFRCGVDIGKQVADKVRTDLKFYIGGNVTIDMYALNWNALPLGATFTARVLEAGGGFKPVVANENIDITLALPPNGPSLQLLGSTLVNGGGEVYSVVPS